MQRYYLKIGKIPELPEQSPSQPHFDLPVYQGRPKIQCVIASTPRSGSSLLGRLLQANGVGVPNEYFNRSPHIAFLSRRWGLINGREELDIDEYLQTIFKYRTTEQGVFSVKAHWDQFQLFLRSGILNRYFFGARFVMIRRRDLLGQAISYEIASQTGQWASNWVGVKEPVYSKDSIHKKIQYIINQYANWFMFFAQNNVPWIEVVYEDLVKYPENTIEYVLRHLVPQLNIKPKAELEKSGLSVQRNQINDQWRERFVKEMGYWRKTA